MHDSVSIALILRRSLHTTGGVQVKSFLIGFLIGIVVLPAFGYLYFRFGYAPVATAASPFPFERSLAHMALNARIEKEAPKAVPIETSTENYQAGVTLYRTHCAFCHGLPGQAQSLTSKGMFPRPPQLFEGHGVTDDPAGETYWKIKNGIRLTGMPAYSGGLTEKEMWQLSIMLANADKLPIEAHNKLQEALQIQ
ncbi:MAG TPA: cytochrome c [Bryobacteraceae bacterium]|jgi:mono/diheme cytochrome c family protein|nr:cytochrome c [Bryobacteraceae bacterium]